MPSQVSSEIYCNGDPTLEYPNFKDGAGSGTDTGTKTFSSLLQAGLVSAETSSLNWPDWIVIGIYFFLVISVGLYAMYKNNKRSTIKGYFLANNSMVWYAVGASLFASNIGSEHYIGLAGSGATGGWTVAVYEFSGMMIVLALGYLFVPVYLSCQAKTMPQYLKLRFGGNRLNFIISVISLLIYIFTKISVNLYAGAIFIQQAMGIESIWWPILILLAITALFTIGGGLSAVIYTDTIQAVIMVIGGIVVAVIAFGKIEGGFSELKQQYREADNACWSDDLVEKLQENENNETIENYLDTCNTIAEDSFTLMRPIDNEDFPWLGVLTGASINSIWYWCADQIIVQRVLSAKNILHARLATILCSFLKISIIFIMVMPGMVSRILFPYTVGCTDEEICQEFCSLGKCNDVAYPYLVLKILPVGLIGLMVAVMLSALVSSLTSIFNSASSVFTINIWPSFRKNASEKELMIVGRVFVLVLIGVSVAWIPIVMQNQTGSLFIYIQMVGSYFQPPICAVYIMGIFMPSVNEIGAFWGMIIGLIIGIVRMVLDTVFSKPSCLDSLLGAEDPRVPVFQKGFAFLLFALFIFGVSIIVGVVVSWWTNRGSDYCAPVRTTWGDRITVTYIGETDDAPGKGQENEAYEEDEKAEHHKDIILDESSETQHKPSFCAKIFNFLCGFSSSDETEQEKYLEEEPIIDLNVPVSKYQNYLINFVAVICVIVSIVCWVLFSVDF